jgi:NADPH:quinone reductase-like Zn-dependent oxidoreductase
MSSAPVNLAAVIVNPFERVTVKEMPYPHPPAGFIVVKVKAASVNPVDGVMQTRNLFNVHHPTVLGFDVAGDVVEIGEGVADRKVGERVIG